MAAAGAIFVALDHKNPFAWLLVNLAWLDVCFSIGVALHEFAHGFAARAVGFRVFRIIIGAGRTWWHGNLLGFDVEAKVFPLSGVAIATPRDLRGVYWKQFLFIFAGPLANGLLFGLAWLVKGPPWEAYASGEFNGWFAFALANFTTFVASLWPCTVQTALGPLPSDGRHLIRFLFRKNLPTPAQLHANGFLMEAALCREKRRPAEARAWLEKGIALYPQNLRLRDSYAVSLIGAEEFQAARVVMIALLADLPAKDPARLTLLNNIAYTDAMLDDPDLLDEADRYSAEALASLPWHPSLKNTRATVLLALNRLDEAMPLLKEGVSRPGQSPESLAECLCTLAIAEARLGAREAAERNLEEARRANPKCFLLPRAEAALQATSVVEVPSPSLSGSLPG
jgi:hypothetical protein